MIKKNRRKGKRREVKGEELRKGWKRGRERKKTTRRKEERKENS